ncbi:2-hydroxyacid dehydrogenase [uncultured Sphaerochaeta sp.]|uniref:2-hydroxyacid dehydrogenase n=1 Tax=uncultured Sphaerochaeta sp. TaxID=886478 RepID=UPI002A0A3AB0|nr:2-hydroxyacid dehydrogenase [uncultured Sphaerochaeta sp.]
MTRLAFFDTKNYDKNWFDRLKQDYDVEIQYFESKLNENSVLLAKGFDVVCAFVNDHVDEAVIKGLIDDGVKLVAMRCAGYNNVDFKTAFGKIHVVRVPAYSPYAVAEHAMALLLSSVRHIHHSYVRTREFNFSLNSLVGFDLHGKVIGIVGTGRIGRVFNDLCKGFGMKVLAYDPFPNPDFDGEYCSFDELCQRSDIISLHCPLTPDSQHLVDKEAIARMKNGVVILNTSRGGLVDSEALLEGIKSKKIGAAALDVYEEEGDIFYEDRSNTILEDDTLMLLISMPNVLVTSHQAFLTDEALHNIAETTLGNIKQFRDGLVMDNEICYHCATCKREPGKRCF